MSTIVVNRRTPCEGNGGNCVEVGGVIAIANSTCVGAAVRDTKQTRVLGEASPELRFNASAWNGFLAHLS